MEDIKINGQNSALHSPDKTKALPTIIFYPGVGGSILSQGPYQFLKGGWSPAFNVVCIQPANAYGTPAATQADITSIKKLVNVSSVHLTGLSGGMGRILQYINAFPGQLGSAVLFSYSPAIDEKTWSEYPRVWGLVGDSDRYANGVKEIVAGVKSTGKEAILTIYPGGHSGWQKFYDPTWEQDGRSIYKFMAGETVSIPVEPIPPVVIPPVVVPPVEPPTGPKRIMLPVKSGGVYVIDVTTKLGAKPGDTLVIPTGTHQIKITGFHGTKEAPIIIEQEDPTSLWGRAGSYIFAIEDATHFIIRKITIDAGITHVGMNLAIGKLTSDYTIEDYTSRYGTNGIKASWGNPTDAATAYPNGPSNIVLRRIKVSDTVTEGLYISNTLAIDANTNPLPARMVNVIAEDITTERTGWDGIQFANLSNLSATNLTVKSFGLANNPIQANGVIIGGYVTVNKLENLNIQDGTGGGLTIFGRGKIHAKNVKISGANTGVYADDYTDGTMGLPPQEIVLENVEVTNSVGKDIEVRNQKKTALKTTYINVKADVAKVVDGTGAVYNPAEVPPKPPVPEPPIPKTIHRTGYWVIDGKRKYYNIFTDFTWEYKA